MVCFFSSRRRHTRCALVTGVQTCALPIWARLRSCIARLDGRVREAIVVAPIELGLAPSVSVDWSAAQRLAGRVVAHPAGVELEALSDRKSVVSGKGVSVRVDLGGRRTITQKNHMREELTHTHQIPT